MLGIPHSVNENLLDLVISIGSKVNYHITKQQLNFVARTPSRDSNSTKSIIASFNNRYVKEDFVAAVRTFNKDILGLRGSSKIYVNYHLTSNNKSFLNTAKKNRKRDGLKFVWVKHCKILARRKYKKKMLNTCNTRPKFCCLTRARCKNFHM
ncbi:unnamed protein product [Pieris macdunnoughi]|uniref:FP protein C-terminal domain-containing protein n=1 Tax=Pieris macdunnoughi TaxID=345717 RepID=A0A821UKA3_9NEOP|nr:unnamed protein product [Pieris macdunnoughi]